MIQPLKPMAHLDILDKPSLGLCLTSVILQIAQEQTFSAFSKYLTVAAVLSTVLYNGLRIIKEIKNK